MKSQKDRLIGGSCFRSATAKDRQEWLLEFEPNAAKAAPERVVEVQEAMPF